ncbi:MAG: homocysteine S-methyltransferase family protein, partial [bacterium]|nr:homocysteine S-methyltransferase family protein [bacterium]
SVGPCGQFLEPLGTITRQQMIDNFRIQIQALSQGGADVILIESMSDIDEAMCAVEAARSVCQLPVALTMTFEKGRQGYRTMMGASIEQYIAAFSQAGVDFLGANCGNGIEQTVEIVHQMRQLTDRYLIAHPNAGIPRLVDGKTIFDQSPQDMARHIPALIHAGANIVGGCCGTGPDHIRHIVAQVSETLRRNPKI